MAGGVRNTKDRDAPALEVRAGTPGVGRTSRDAAGLSSTNRTELNWPEHQWRTVRDPSVLRQRLNFGRYCSALRRGTADHQGKPPENKSLEIPAHRVPTIPPRRGHGDSTQTGLPEYQSGRPLPQKAG